MSEPTKIDITSTAIEKGIDLTKDFVGKLVGPLAEELGLFASDNIRFWRFKNQLAILEKTRKYVEENGINVKNISPKILVPLLEGASLEEDADLRNMWSSLLVNYIDIDKTFQSSVFPYILSQLSSVEARALEYICEKEEVDDFELEELFEVYDAETSNLIRLGVIRESLPEIEMQNTYVTKGAAFVMQHGTVLPEFKASYKDELLFEITDLGRQFINACKLSE